MARRKVARGWMAVGVDGENEVLAVGNIVNVSSILLGGDDVQDDGPMADGDAEFLVRRVIINSNIVVNTTALNLSGGLWLNAALVVVDDSRYTNDLDDKPFDIDNSITDWWERSARVLRVDELWVPSAPASTDFTAFSTPTFPGVAGQFLHSMDMSWRGGFNIRHGQSLRYVVGQSYGKVTPNIVGDSYVYEGMARVLLQERRRA